MFTEHVDPSARASRLRGAAWSGLSIAAFVASIFVGFVLQVLQLEHGVFLAAWSIGWGVASLGGVAIAARIAFGRWLRIGASAIVVGSGGVGLSAAVILSLYQWMEARFGMFDLEYAWWTGYLPVVLIGLSAAAFGMESAPSGARRWPAGAVAIGSMITILIVLSNLPGIADGSVRAESWPLAMAIGLSAVYAVACLVIAVRRWTSQRRTSAT